MHVCMYVYIWGVPDAYQTFQHGCCLSAETHMYVLVIATVCCRQDKHPMARCVATDSF